MPAAMSCNPAALGWATSLGIILLAAAKVGDCLQSKLHCSGNTCLQLKWNQSVLEGFGSFRESPSRPIGKKSGQAGMGVRNVLSDTAGSEYYDCQEDTIQPYSVGYRACEPTTTPRCFIRRSDDQTIRNRYACTRRDTYTDTCTFEYIYTHTHTFPKPRIYI